MNVPFDMVAHPGPYTSTTIYNRSSQYDHAHIYDANGAWVETIDLEGDESAENYVGHLNEEWGRFQQTLEDDDEEGA